MQNSATYRPDLADHLAIRRDVIQTVKPPRHMTVSDAAERYLRVEQGGAFVPWDRSLTPYLVEPLNCISDRMYDAVVVVGPARSGKTIMILGGVAYIVKVDPADAMIIHTDKNLARKFSKTDVERSIQNSPALAAELSTRSSDDNVFDKTWRSGKMLTIGWPTISQLSSHTTKYMFSTDYDRRREDDLGEGDLFGMMRKRHESFMSSGKTVIETSPGFPIKNPQWKPSTDHEAPPCDGAMSWYNQGDRRRRYWQCIHCNEWFMANFEYMVYEKDDDIQKASESARMQCPHCQGLIEPQRKREIDNRGVWLMDGQKIDRDGVVSGNGNRSNIASFWFEGPVACFQTWSNLVLELIRAEDDYASRGVEDALLRTVTQDQGRPYLPKSREDDRTHSELKDRAEEIGYRVVPNGVRYLMASIDIQARSFVVQVEGFGIGQERWYIDRFAIEISRRKNEEGEFLPCRPPVYLEDWKMLVDKVIRKRYPLADGSGREMKIKLVTCDSQGRTGTTQKAYAFWRYLKRNGLTSSFKLIRGGSQLTAPRIRESWPDSDRKDRKAGARGEVPVWILNTNVLKDAVNHDLSRYDEGPGFTHFPHWLEDDFFKELVSETRDDAGRWKKEFGRRNETLDLTVYNLAGNLISKADKINWLKPPRWAREWDDNSLVIEPSQDTGVPKKNVQDAAERRQRLASKLTEGT